jgi:hypothetical protein
MSEIANADPNSVHKVLVVRAPRAVAWRVFTERIGSWWPLDRHLDRYGARRDEMRRVFDTEGDWGRLLALFAGLAEGGKA